MNDDVDEFGYCDEAIASHQNIQRHANPGCVMSNSSNCEEGDKFGSAGIYGNTNWHFLANQSLGLSDCKDICKRDCSCVAYGTNNTVLDVGCRFLYYSKIQDLIPGLKQYSKEQGQILYVRQSILQRKAKQDRRKRMKRKGFIICGSTVGACLLVSMSFYLLWKRRLRLQGKYGDSNNESAMYELDTTVVGDVDRDANGTCSYHLDHA
ncbi:hypothetical protein ACFE04_009473 [Oxalis oulophora]